MAICPKCKCEYVEGIHTCADCNIPLVDSLPPEEPFEYDTEAFLVEVGNEIEAQMIINVLKNENIPCLRKYASSGDLMRIYGFTKLGARLYVPSRALDRARELIKFEPLEIDESEYEHPIPTPFFNRDKWMSFITYFLGGIALLIYLLYQFGR